MESRDHQNRNIYSLNTNISKSPPRAKVYRIKFKNGNEKKCNSNMYTVAISINSFQSYHFHRFNKV